MGRQWWRKFMFCSGLRKRRGGLQVTLESDRLRVFTGTSNPELVHEICGHIGIPCGDIELNHFADGEISVQIKENVRGADVFLVQSTSNPTNENLMELLVMIDAARRASAKKITAVLPYFGYARQDRKDKPRVAITAKLVANLIVTAGADRVLTLDLHAGQIQGFFDIPVDHLYAIPVFIKYLRSLNLEDVVVVSPDPGGGKRARAYGKLLGAPIAFIDKRRPKANVAEALHVIGEVEGRHAIIVDDLVDTGGTLAAAATALLKEGALSVYACCTHGVLSGTAAERLCDSDLKELVITNTIKLGDKACEKFKVMSVSKLLADAIVSIHEETSVGRLFLDLRQQEKPIVDY